jgi:uncharacterized protein YbjQ (UPF0145 family)
MSLFRRSHDETQRVALVTTEAFPGYDVVAVVGFASGSATNAGAALDQLEQNALEWDADAVVAVRVASSSRGGAFVGDDRVFAYGTAVKLRRRSAPGNAVLSDQAD